MKLFHVSAKIYLPGDLVPRVQRNYCSDPARQPLDVVRMQEILDRGRSAAVVSRLCAHFAFAKAELCSWYWSSQEARARRYGESSSPYLLPPHYYEVEMDAPVEAPLAVAGWVYTWTQRCGSSGRRPAVVDRTNLAHFLHGEDWKKAAAMWPLPG